MPARSTYLLAFSVTALLLAISLYLQLIDGIEPCPLCTLQRLDFILLGMLFLIGACLNRARLSHLLLNFLTILTSLGGMFLAGRQVWLQHFPSTSNECGVTLQYMLKVLPVNEVLQKIFQGSAECATRGFEFLGMNMAEWAFIWFGLFLLFSCYSFYHTYYAKNFKPTKSAKTTKKRSKKT